MNAEIVAVGTELLLGEIVDTNTVEISESLAGIGVNVYYHAAVGDNPLRLAAVLSQALSRSDLVIVTGGLGPTADDITKEMLAAVTGRRLILHEGALSHIEGFFRALGREMTENNRRQAMIPEGAEILANPRGTAPGVHLIHGGKHVFCLPGVPHEMRTMWRESVLPRLGRLLGEGSVIRSRVLRFYGIGESALEARVEEFLKGNNPTVAPYPGNGEVRLRITARAASEEEALRLIDPVELELRRRVGEFLYGKDDESLEAVAGRLLREAGWSLALAESCTGGLIGHRLTNIPGSSAFLRQGWIVYSNEAKVQELGVDDEAIRRSGAVSEEVAAQMAAGALARSGADIAVGVTGIAGPDGGTEAKPVGTVCFGVAGRGWSRTVTRRFRGNREDIKWRSASEALDLIRQSVLERAPGMM